MRVLEDWQSTIANNLANSSTPGFQKNTFAIASREKPLVKTPMPLQPLTPLALGQPIRVVSDGEVRVTGNPFDMAVHGGAFFAVRNDEGQTLYTKDGEFRLNAEGVLINKMGYPVLADGDALALLPDAGPITVATDGTVSQDGENIGRISVFQFAEPNNLIRTNGSYFMDLNNNAGAQEVESPTILQGQLMGSSVSPLTEMVSMIEASRAYEITQKIIQENDERGGKVIQAFTVT